MTAGGSPVFAKNEGSFGLDRNKSGSRFVFMGPNLVKAKSSSELHFVSGICVVHAGSFSASFELETQVSVIWVVNAGCLMPESVSGVRAVNEGCFFSCCSFSCPSLHSAPLP